MEEGHAIGRRRGLLARLNLKVRGSFLPGQRRRIGQQRRKEQEMRLTTITYQDELQPDRSVRRSYSNGTFEWRRKLSDGRVEWQDSSGHSGIDEQLGGTHIKRTFSGGEVRYGREQGYGRTAWSGGEHLVTVNQSSFGGRVGMILAGVGAGMLMGNIVWPPDIMTLEQEEELRRQASDSGDGGSDWGDSGSDWGDDSGGGDWGSDSDFG